MKPEKNGTESPCLRCSLQVSADLHRVGSPGDPLNRAVESAISQALAELMETLGISGKPAVEIKAIDGPLPDERFVRLAIEDQVLRYPDETVQLVYCWSTGSIFRVDVTLADILAWLTGQFELEETTDLVAGFFSQLTIQVFKAQPSVLLGATPFEAYRASLPIPATGEFSQWPPDPAWLRPILAKTLSLGISIADKQAVTDALAQNLDKPWSDACEELIERLRPNAIEIHVTREYLRELTTFDADNRTGFFAFLRDGLFQELGVVYPDFRLVLDPRLGPRQFLFTINHLPTMPLVGLSPDECLVNENPERLTERDISLRPAGNPATALQNSLTSLDNKADLEKRGYTTWDQMGYVILCLAAILRRSGHCLIHRGFTDGLLHLASTGFPELVKTAQSVFSVERITTVLRNLAMEELPIRNSRLILEILLDFHLRESSAAGRPHPDTGVERGKENASDLRVLTEFVRAGMKRQVSGKVSRETNTMPVYLLDEHFEELLIPQIASGEDREFNFRLTTGKEDQVLEAIRREIATLPPTAQVPSILTVAHLRWPLRATIAKELPRMQVVAFDELTPSLNVFPVARISALVE